MTDLTIVATGLRFPEGPVMLADGSVALVEIARGTVSRVAPDGALYVRNNGGFVWHEEPNMIRPIGTPDDYSGGRIERVDPATGGVTVLYDSCNGIKLKGPNDIVFDRFGGPDLRTAFVTLSGIGQLVSMPRPAAGLKLNYAA